MGTISRITSRVSSSVPCLAFVLPPSPQAFLCCSVASLSNQS